MFGDIIEGAAEAIYKLMMNGWFIHIFTTRPETVTLIQWLNKNNVCYNAINSTEYNPPDTSIKPIATIYLDDRAWPLMGKQFTKETWEQIVEDLMSLDYGQKEKKGS